MTLATAINKLLRDPNDIGDEEWAADALVESLELRYLPRINGESVVLELGPGSGRLIVGTSLES
jgi:hypothetical protein